MIGGIAVGLAVETVIVKRLIRRLVPLHFVLPLDGAGTALQLLGFGLSFNQLNR